MKKRNSNKISPLIWVVSTLLLLPIIAFATPILANTSTVNDVNVINNVPPTITYAPTEVISSEGQFVAIQIEATDADITDTLSYLATGLPAGVGIGSDGKISGIAVATQDASVTVTVFDGNGGQDSATFDWEVKNGTNVGNPSTAQDGERVDGWPSNMVINLSDEFTNYTSSPLTVYVTGFSFNADNQNQPLTPFVVKVDADKDPDDHEFTVVAVGTTRTNYSVGSNTVFFKDGGKTITLQPDETLLTGFIDANADGTGGVPGQGTIRLTDTDDDVWYSGEGDVDVNGFSVTEGQPPQPRLENVQGGQEDDVSILRRSYAFNIHFGTDAPYVGPPATPTPSPTPVAAYQIKNGSFEADSAGNDKTSLTNWEVVEGDVDITDQLSTEGDQSLDLNAATISQTVSGLDIGTTYILRIDYQGNREQSGTGTMADAEVRIDGESRSMWWRKDIPDNVPEGIHSVNAQADWTLCNGFVFEPSSTMAVIEIDSLEIGQADGLRIDNVRIEEYAGIDTTEFTHDVNSLDMLEDGWLQLASGDFEFRNSQGDNELPPNQSDPQNSGSDTNPHLCGIGTETSGLDNWFVPRETIDMVEGFALPPGSISGNWVADLGGEGPGALVQIISGLEANATHYLRFYAARHPLYGNDDMTSELWINNQLVKEIVRTADQKADESKNFILEIVEVTSDAEGKVQIELFSTNDDNAGNVVYDNFSIIAQDNLPSIITPQGNLLINNVGDEVEVPLPASDAISETITYAAQGLPPGVTISETTGTISGILTTADTYTVTVSISAENSATFPGASATFNWIVNTIPEIDPIDDQSNNEGELVNLAISAMDADGDDLTYSVSELPSGLGFDSGSNAIVGTITAPGGPYSITVSVDDDNGGVASTSFTWTVNGNPDITAPSDQAGGVGDDVSLMIVASDPESAALTFSATGLPDGLTIDENSGEISGTLAATGEFAVTITANDGTGGVESIEFNWTVTQNSPPVFGSNPGTQVAQAGDTINLSVTATDADSDTLTYAADMLPAGLTIDSATGLISGTLTEGGQTATTVTVTDGNGGSDTITINWDIADPEPPVTTFTIYLPLIVR